MKIKTFLKHCHEKEVFKMLSIYVVSSWILLQVMAVTWQALGIPLKTGTYLIIILLLGFPLYIFFIWKLHVKPLNKGTLVLDEIEIHEKAVFKKIYFISFSVITVCCIVSVMLIINKNFINEAELPTVIKTNKIAVLKFGNNTGNPAYDVISKMASDWIIHGITENQAGQVISQEMVDEYNLALGGKSTDTDLTSEVKEYLRPSKIISGNFYLKNNKLIFHCVVKDGNNDETLISFKPSECSIDDALVCIDDLKESILGFLMTEGRKKEMLQRSPPKYDAYTYVLEAKNTELNKTYLHLLNSAIEADSTYFEPKVLRVAYYYNLGNFIKADSLLKTIRPDLNNKRQLNLLNSYKALLNGNNKKVYSTIIEEYEIAPFDLKSNKSAMVAALQYVNRPEEVVPIFNAIKMESLDLQNCQDCLSRVYVYALANIELKKYDTVMRLLEPLTQHSEETFLKKPLITAYIRSGEIIKTDLLISEIQIISSKKAYENICLFTAKEYLLIENTPKANRYLNSIINEKNENSDNAILAEAYYFKQDFKNAEKLLEAELKRTPNNLECLSKLAICSFKLNKTPQAQAYLKTIEAQRGPYSFGSIDYALAQFYAATENTSQMNAHLIKAVAEGKLYTSQTFQNDPHFIKYKNTKAFAEIFTFWH